MGFKENLAFFKKVMQKNIIMWNQNWFTSDGVLDNKNYDSKFSWIGIPTLITTQCCFRHCRSIFVAHDFTLKS